VHILFFVFLGLVGEFGVVVFIFGAVVVTSVGKNSNSGQMWVRQFGQCQNSNEKWMSDTRFFRVGQFGRG